MNDDDGQVTLVHSSDLHIDDESGPRKYDGLAGLRAVLSKARLLKAHVVLLAGDTFDNHRISTPTLQTAAELMAETNVPILLLPGNHDPILPNCLFRRAGLDGISNVFVFGLDGRDCVEFPALQLEVFGFPHIGTHDFRPVSVPRPRRHRWQILMAHGHYVTLAEWREQSHRSWRMGDEDIAATKADYLALGHWDRAAAVGDGSVPAYYSGSPDLAESVNLVRLNSRSGVRISREPITWDS